MIGTPSRNSRTPSSARAVKVVLPATNRKRPVQRTEKLSTGSPAGPPAPQSLLIALSHAVRTGVPVSVVLLKYSAKNWPVGQALGPVMVNVATFEATGAGLTTRTVAVPTVAMSAAAMAAVTWVGSTTVVGRALPFHSTVAPVAKPLPSTVSVKSGPPAA